MRMNIKLKCLLTTPPTGGKFIAFFNDGSGASLYYITKNGNMLDTDGCDQEINASDLIDNNYSQWAQLPDDFKYWFEIE